MMNGWVVVGAFAMAALAGCAKAPAYIDSDFTYKKLSDQRLLGGEAGKADKVGFEGSSKFTGKAFEIFAICSPEARRYFIQETGVSPGRSGKQWVARLDGGELWNGRAEFYDESTYLKSLGSLEVIRAPKGIAGEERMKVASRDMEQLPGLCKAKQEAALNEGRGTKSEPDRQKDRRSTEVSNRTGLLPMLSGENRMDLNNLALLYRTSGTGPYENKFVWVDAGDYEAVEITEGKVLLVSRFSPTFPAVLFLINTKPSEGRSSFPLFTSPMKLIGTSSYETRLGYRKQLIIFEGI